MTKINIARLAIVLLFAIAFTFIGVSAPVIYASYVPQDSVIEEHSFTAQDVSPEADQHFICFDRTVHQPSSGQVFTELYLISDDHPDARTEIESKTMERYFQRGRSKVVTPLNLPNELQQGTYRYLLVVKLDMADGRVERAFTFNSEPFTISKEISDRKEERPIVC
jgi:hypothetical protein